MNVQNAKGGRSSPSRRQNVHCIRPFSAAAVSRRNKANPAIYPGKTKSPGRSEKRPGRINTYPRCHPVLTLARPLTHTLYMLRPLRRRCPSVATCLAAFVRPHKSIRRQSCCRDSTIRDSLWAGAWRLLLLINGLMHYILKNLICQGVLKKYFLEISFCLCYYWKHSIKNHLKGR